MMHQKMFAIHPGALTRVTIFGDSSRVTLRNGGDSNRVTFFT